MLAPGCRAVVRIRAVAGQRGLESFGRRAMAYRSHEERTAAEPRETDLHAVTVNEIEQVGHSVRLLKLGIKDEARGVKFLPGQWLDVHVPGIHKAGGFTITSIPADATSRKSSDISQPFLELAIQHSPRNPPAAWLWRPQQDVVGQKLIVRVGGTFVWPPAGISLPERPRLLLVAGGVGINPIVSILAHLSRTDSMPEEVILMYSTKLGDDKDGGDVLFLNRILEIQKASPKLRVRIYSTTKNPGELRSGQELRRGAALITYRRRILSQDFGEHLGNTEERMRTICYICGPKLMTDSIVDHLRSEEGVDPRHVLCEKWW